METTPKFEDFLNVRCVKQLINILTLYILIIQKEIIFQLQEN